MSKESFPWNTIILLGALAVGGYFLYEWLKNNPITQAMGGAIDTTKKVIDTGTSPGGLPKPVVKALKLDEFKISLPEPVDLIEPINLIPHIVETVAVDTKGNINPWKAPILASLGVGFLTGALKPKATVLKAPSKTQIPIVTVNPVTKGVSILRPLEIVKTGQAIHKVNIIAKTEGAYKTIGITQPISPSKSVTVTKTLGVPTKVTISKLMRS